MDPAHAPFLAARMADPDSDSSRLKYADFLEETGEAGYLLALVGGLLIRNARPERFIKAGIVIYGAVLGAKAAEESGRATAILFRGLAAIIEAYLIYRALVYLIARKAFGFSRGGPPRWLPASPAAASRRRFERVPVPSDIIPHTGPIRRRTVGRMPDFVNGELADMNDDHFPFLRTILAAPGDFAPRLVYADWLEERGDPRAEYVRAWVAMMEKVRAGEPSGDEKARVIKLHDTINRHWAGLVESWQMPVECDPEEVVSSEKLPTNDCKLGYGPCVLCGRKVHMKRWVSRLPCEKCGRVWCWECADTGVYGSLSDFLSFIEGRWSRPQYRLGSDSCPCCQEMDWMRAHGG